jgi:hypothetical protein
MCWVKARCERDPALGNMDIRRRITSVIDATCREEPFPDELSEDLETALHRAQLAPDDHFQGATNEPHATIEKRPEVIDDFIRNFCMRCGLTQTLECFENEWCVHCFSACAGMLSGCHIRKPEDVSTLVQV